MEERIYNVNLNNINQRLDTFVASLDVHFTRSMAQKQIKNGNILVNDKNQKESYKLKNNDVIKVIIKPPKETTIKAENIKLDIVYEDEYVLVVNKPKGMVVHPASGNYEGTLVNAVLNHCKNSLSGIGGEIRPRNST